MLVLKRKDGENRLIYSFMLNIYVFGYVENGPEPELPSLGGSVCRGMPV